MYKVLVILSLFIFHPAWSYINEKGPGQLPWPKVADIHPSGPMVAAPTVLIQFVERGDHLMLANDEFLLDESDINLDEFIRLLRELNSNPEKKPSDGELGSIENKNSDVRPSGPMAIKAADGIVAFAPTVLIETEEEGPTFLISDGRPSGPFVRGPTHLAGTPTVLIQLADVHPSTPVLGPGQSEVAIKLVGPDQQDWFIKFVKGPGQMPWVDDDAPTVL